jgi:hypothetical protein
LDQDIQIKRHLTLEPVRDGPAQLMSQDTQGFSFVMFFL